MSLIIREASEADLPGVLALYAQPQIDGGKLLPLDAAREIFARFRTYPDYRLFVVEDALQGPDAEGRLPVVGSFALLVMDNLGHLGARSAIIEDVVVDPTLHRRGIGRAMMQRALEEAKARGCYKASLSSNMKREAAHAFYDSLGFERHGYSFRVAFTEDER